MKNFAVLASGKGGNLDAIIKAMKAGHIKAHLTVVFSDKKDAGALTIAREANVPAVHLSPKDYKDRVSFDHAVVKELEKYKVDFVVLAGYMRLVSAAFINQFPDKILNIHPSILPSFKGMHAIRDAYDYGVKVTGPTVHFVVEEMDMGAIILQEPVRVDDEDTFESLKEKIHQAEHRIYPQAVALMAEGRLAIKNNKTIVL